MSSFAIFSASLLLVLTEGFVSGGAIMWTWYLSERSLERAFPVVLDSMTTTLPSGILAVKEEMPRSVVGNSKVSFFVWPSKVNAVQFLLCASTPTVVVVVAVVVTHSSPPVHASGTDNLP